MAGHVKNGGAGVDEQEVWWVIRGVFWSILLFVAIRIGMAVIFGI
jgi:hypothetical protein